MGTPDNRFRDEKGELVRDGFTYIRLCGEAIADLADRALRQPQPITLAPLEIYARPIMIPLDNPGFRAARAAGVLSRPVFAWTGRRDQKGDEIAAGKTDGEQAMETEVAYLRLGELDIAAIPGELYPELARMRTVLTIHNLAYQGRFPRHDWHLLNLDARYFVPDFLEFYGRINYLK
ncbi:MAG: glycogen/starch synthase, partial [Planctomycetia bacterium]|nr:glycogen/starch synthase [Planctomycetia bacterium]